MEELRVPGKVFLMGEYGVVKGGKALLAALRPGILYRTGSSIPHPESPLGIYCKEHAVTLGLELQPQSSLGPGFGTSTAEFIAGLLFLKSELPKTDKLWAWFTEKFPRMSGADLAVQVEALRAKQGFFKIEGPKKLSALPSSRLFHQIFIFQSSNKILTHDALKVELPELDLARMNEFVDRIENAFLLNHEKDLTVFSLFADYLSSLGLETASAKQVRISFSTLPFVIGVKGCGAGLNDVFIVGVKHSSIDSEIIENTRAQLEAVAKQFDLSSLGLLSERLWS